MNLFIPDIGTLLKLEQDWTFTLYSERRTESLMRIFSQETIPTDAQLNWNLQTIRQTLYKNQVVELPRGLVIKVDRVYIRKGLSQFSSITFTVPKPKTKKEKEEMPHNVNFASCKFWVKLHECNGVQFTTVQKNSETTTLFQKLYLEIEKDASTKFGVQKCTKMLADINRLLGVGQNINNLSTPLRYDQFLNHLIHKMKDNVDLEKYLSDWFKREMRDFKLKQLI
jgi:hypothetical protein